MGWFSWIPGFSEKKEEKPPEALVLGAILRCPYGSHDSYLYLDTSGTTVNNLPKASVEDYKALFNIQPFGYCIEGGFCKDSMSLDKKWENPEPQREKINGKEIITTKSLLSCRTCGMEFKIINSGQDGINAEHILLMEDMDKNYPGLRILLDNTNGSLYLNEGMYNTAIRFIEDRMNLNGGEITIPTLFNKNNLEGAYIRGALGRLIMECDTVSAETLSNGIQNTFSNNDEVGNNEINSLIINKEMINQLRIVCKDVDKKIATDPVKRWQEKNKLSLSVAAEVVSNFTYGVIIYYSSIGNVNNKQNTGEKSAIEKKNTVGSGTEGAGGVFNKGKKVFDNFNVNDAYVKPKHLSTTSGNARQFLGATKADAEIILKDAMNNGTITSVVDDGVSAMGNQKYKIIIDAGKTIGTRGESLIEIILSDDGGMLSAFPIS